MDKVEMTAQEELKAKEELKAQIVAIAQGTVSNPGMEVAKLANKPYDAEIAVPEVIKAIFNTASVDVGEDFDYFAIAPIDKKVFTVSNGIVTQTNVSVDSENALVFSSYDSDEDYVYLDDILDGKYDPIALRATVQQEALDRLEIKAVTDLVIDGAVAQSNSYAFTSGEEKFTFEKCVEMVRSVAKYGTKLVLITGADVTTDVMLWDFDEDKNRELSIQKAGIAEWHKLEANAFTHSGAQVIFPADKALVVAVSDSKSQKPGYFVRRKVSAVAMGQGVDAKERLIISSGPAKHVGSARKLAIAVLTYERFGAVLSNEYTCAVFKRANSYS